MGKEAVQNKMMDFWSGIVLLFKKLTRVRIRIPSPNAPNVLSNVTAI